MTSPSVRLLLAALTLPWIFAPRAVADDDSPTAITVRLIQPDAQLDRFLRLFEGARFPHPAAAFAAWKRENVLDRAAPEPFSKGREALIAFLNPEMVRELKTLDGGRFSLRFDAETGRSLWSLTVPRDDGTFAGIATAFSLTGGAEVEPIEGARVDRLGPKNAPFLAQKGELVIIASSQNEAARALKQRENIVVDPQKHLSAVVAELDLKGFSSCGNLPARQIFAGLRSAGTRDLSATAAWEQDDLTMSVSTRLSADSSLGLGAIEADWLDYAPKDRTIAVVSVSIDPKPATWNAFFSALDRGLRVDPANAKLAPARARLGVLTLPSRARLETDFFPRVVGVTFLAVGESGKKRPDGFVAAIHCDSNVSAQRLAIETFPRLAGVLLKSKKIDPARKVDDIRVLGEVSGRAVAIALRERTVLLSWGDRDPLSTISACLDARAHLERSAGPIVREGWKRDAPSPARAGAFWPGSLFELSGGSPRLATALAPASPVVWIGVRDDSTLLDSFRWSGARGTIKRFLDALPVGKPPISH